MFVVLDIILVNKIILGMEVRNSKGKSECILVFDNRKYYISFRLIIGRFNVFEKKIIFFFC